MLIKTLSFLILLSSSAFGEVRLPIDQLSPYGGEQGRFILHQKNGFRAILDCVSFIHGLQIQVQQNNKWEEDFFLHLYSSECVDIYDRATEMREEGKSPCLLLQEAEPPYAISDEKSCGNDY